ncbi:MAG: tetratricopeptide repeat protein [Verrucomicrobiaceae bacterium]|nr:tetratricopeptide repeat protein [Verrucomicrobiaceae bacterium]
MIFSHRVIRSVRVAAPLRVLAERGIWCLTGLACLTLHAASEADLSLGKQPPAKSDLQLTQRGASNADALAHYSAALQFESAGKLRLALDHYLAVFKADPTNADLASHTAALALQFQGRDAALKILEDAVAANPASPEPLLNLARFCSTYPPEDLFAKDDRALKAVSTALEKFPGHAAVYEAAVMHHLTQNKRDEAAKVMEQATKQVSADPRFWLDLGSVAERVWPLGQSELRPEHLARVTPFFETALKHVTKADAEPITLEVAQHFLMANDLARSQQLCEELAAKHGSLSARKLLFRMYEASQQEEKAMSMLEQVVKQAPDDVEHQRLLARAYEKREQPEKAIPHYEAAIQQGGELADYVSLGWQFWETRKHEEMVRVGERAVKLFPDHPLVHYQLAIGCRAREQYEKSAAHFAEAEDLSSGGQAEMLDHTFYFQYGITLSRLQRHEDAVRVYQKSIQLTPPEKTEFAADVFFQYGVTLGNLNRDEEAATVLEKSISLTPPERSEFAANTMNYLGFMWLEKDTNLDKAGGLIQRANELVPNNPAYVDSLGWFHFKKGDFTKALAELQRAASLIPELQPEDAEILEHIGLAHEKLGDKTKAREQLEKAAALKTPDDKIRRRIENTLKRMLESAPKAP